MRQQLPPPNYNVDGIPYHGPGGGQWSSGGGMSPTGAGIGGMIGGLIGGSGGGGDMGMGYLDKIPGLYDPYIQAGMRGLPTLEQQYGMGADPSQSGNILSQLGAGYQQSPGYQYALDQAMKGVNRSAAAGGTLGTPGAMTAAAGAAQGLASQDYNTYIQNQLGLRSQGLQGLQGLYNTGFDATTGTANAYQTQAQMEYERQAAQNAAGAQAGGGIGSIIGGLAGTAIGGPIGGMIGGGIGGLF